MFCSGCTNTFDRKSLEQQAQMEQIPESDPTHIIAASSMNHRFDWGVHIIGCVLSSSLHKAKDTPNNTMRHVMAIGIPTPGNSVSRECGQSNIHLGTLQKCYVKHLQPDPNTGVSHNEQHTPIGFV